MNAPSIDTAEMLDAESGLNLVYGTNLYAGREPASPADVVTIFDVAGGAPQITFDNQKFENVAIQVRVRNVDYETGYALAENIKDSLHARAQETWNGTLYSVVYCTSGPFLLDYDKKQRPRFIINFNIKRR